MTFFRSCVLGLGIALAAFAWRASSQEHYPSRVVTIVVPITPGTAMDIQARLYADGLSKRGYQVIVENKPGAGTLIGAETVAKASADGYTILFTNSAHTILGTMNKNLPFDPIADFAGVCLTGQAPAIVTVPRSLGVHTLREFVALAKAKPGTINYGSAGIGTATHLAGAYFAYKTDTQLVHVPYTVTQGIITDLLAGTIQATFSPEAFTLAFLKDGRLLGLAVASDTPIERSDSDSHRGLRRRGLHVFNLVRISGAGQDAARYSQEASRRHRRGEQGSRPPGQNSPARHRSSEHRACGFRRLCAQGHGAAGAALASIAQSKQ